MLRDQTRQYISSLSDVELITYLSEGGYEPEAIEFAMQQAASRKIDPARLAELESQAQAQAHARVAERAEAAAAPLGSLATTLSFIAGIGLLGVGAICLLIAWGNFRAKGETLKSQQMWRLARFGFASFLVFAMSLFLLAFWLGRDR